ncbi:MAG: sensor histidine kinase, partial [Odoribacter sp.]|nr:sensor histidine kinase [Odoribacter sp.]
MIKKIIIKILLVVMVAAFTAVVVVQWLWIKYAIQERENKFTSQVYDVLNRVVNQVDEINYIKYRQEMNQHLGELKSYNDMIAARQGDQASASREGYSEQLFNFLNNDVNRLNEGRSFLNAFPYPRSNVSKIVDQELIIQTIRSMELPRQDSIAKVDFYVHFGQKMQEFIIRLLKEKDPENISVAQRL